MTLLIDKLKISAFGGIPESLEFDLNVPLTLLYAPNGTGKTSVIESLSWMFDGECREARCTESNSSLNTCVEITANSGESDNIFKKQLGGAGQTSTYQINNSKKGITEFLGRLAPECNVVGLNHKAQISRLSAYLNSNRILTVGTLGSVIDDSDAESRSDAMADLLGTRYQRNVLKQLESYEKRIVEKSALMTANLQTEKIRLEDLKSKFKPVNQSLDDIVSKLSALLDIDSGSDPDLNIFEVQCRKELNETKSNYQILLEHFDYLTEQVEFESPASRISKLKAKISKSNSDLKKVKQSLSKNKADKKKFWKEVSRYKRLEEQYLEIKSLLSELDVLTPNEYEGLSLSRIRTEISEIESRFGSLNKIEETLSVVEEKFEEWKDQHKKIEFLEKNIESKKSKLAGKRSRSKVEKELKEIADSYSSITSTVSSLEGLRAELFFSAKEICKHDPGDGHCPTCGYNWKSTSDLTKAIEETEKRLSRSENEIIRTKEKYFSQMKTLEEELGEIQRIQKAVDAMSIEKKSLTSELKRADKFSGQFGVGSFMDFTRTFIDNQNKKVEYLKHWQEVESKYSKFQAPLVQFKESQKISDLVIEWSSKLEGFNAEYANLSYSIEQIDEKIEELESDCQSLEDRLGEVERELSEVKENQELIAESLEVFELEKLTKNNLGKANRSVIQPEEKIINEAEIHLSVLSDTINASFIEAEIQKCQNTIAEIDTQLKSVRSESKKVDSAKNEIQYVVDAQRQTVLEKLGPAVSELFQRMQVNRVFSGIKFDDDAKLAGVLGDSRLDPSKFSQGQRQDLALSFFLVRAYTMGGTFFLDEPLAHLDDLNRVALLDTLRSFVLSTHNRKRQTRIVLTTASWTTARHVIEKMSTLYKTEQSHLLNVYQLIGNVMNNVTSKLIYPTS